MRWIKRFLNSINIFKGFMKPMPRQNTSEESTYSWQNIEKTTPHIEIEDSEETAFDEIGIPNYFNPLPELRETSEKQVATLEPIVMATLIAKEPEIKVVPAIKIEETTVYIEEIPAPKKKRVTKPKEIIKKKVVAKKKTVAKTKKVPKRTKKESNDIVSE